VCFGRWFFRQDRFPWNKPKINSLVEQSCDHRNKPKLRNRVNAGVKKVLFFNGIFTCLWMCFFYHWIVIQKQCSVIISTPNAIIKLNFYTLIKKHDTEYVRIIFFFSLLLIFMSCFGVFVTSRLYHEHFLLMLNMCCSQWILIVFVYCTVSNSTCSSYFTCSSFDTRLNLLMLFCKVKLYVCVCVCICVAFIM
jgi:hypothetical protein